MKIVFSDVMFTNFNISYINESNTNMLIIPALNRYMDEDFDPLSIGFKWKAMSFIKDTLII